MILVVLLLLVYCVIARCPDESPDSPDIGIYWTSVETDAVVWSKACETPMGPPFDSGKNTILLKDPAGTRMYSTDELDRFIRKWLGDGYNVGISNFTDDTLDDIM